MRAKKLQAITREALARQAQTLLDLDTVLTMATKAASEGASKLRLTLEVPGNLKDTEAAKNMQAILEREGFKVSWETRLIPAKANSSGADINISEPVIHWGDGAS